MAVRIASFDSTARGSGDAIVRGLVHSAVPRHTGSAAIQGANVYAPAVSASVGTDPDGAFELRIAAKELPVPAIVSVRARSVGYGPASIDLPLAQGDRVVLQLALCADVTRLSEVMVTGIEAASASITNTQHDGVDEGGIVKRHGDHLVVLRRGRLYTVDVGRGRLRPVAAVNAYGPGIDPEQVWYDELVVAAGRVIVIGYSYGAMATELGVFAIDAHGALQHESTYHLRSHDYYSSENYATRLIGSRLFLYAPLPLRADTLDPLASLPAMRRWEPSADQRVDGGFRPIATPRRVFRQSASDSAERHATLHVLTACDVAAREFTCEATVVLGGWSRVFYVSPRAVYVASAATAFDEPGDEPRGRPAILFRLPLDSTPPTAKRIRGLPIDQFSFLEEDTHLNLLLESHGFGDGMWGAEFRRGSLALLRLPLDEFAAGELEAPASAYRPLPYPSRSHAVQNRFVGRHLLYGVGNSWGHPQSIAAELFVVPLEQGNVVRHPLAHGVDRIEILGGDALIVGTDSADLHLARLRLSDRTELVARHVVRGATQGETRSHGFFFRPDANSPERGLLGLPVAREGRPGYAQLLEESSAVLFLRAEPGGFRALGELEARPELAAADDDCVASCVDWYGNSRPLFLDGRILALLGYELVEGRLRAGRLWELRRVSFAPVR